MEAERTERVWCNIGSPSEVAGILEVMTRVRAGIPARTVLLTASRSVRLPDTLPDGMEQAPKPYDLPQAVERFLADQKPDVTVLSGSDLFPSAIAACRRKDVPMILANARSRDGSGLQGRLTNFRIGARLRAFERILAVDREDADRLIRKGAPADRVEVLGALEEVFAAPLCDESERAYLARKVATRPLWLAAGLPRAELEAVEAAFRLANRQSHRLLLVVSPADPSEAEDMTGFFEASGWNTARREEAEEPEDEVQVYVADAPDEAGLWYRLAPITYLGGTLSGGPFPDPFHPAALGSAVIHGTAVASPSPQLTRLIEENACRAVTDAGELGATVADLLAPDRAATLAGRAWDVTSRGAEAAERAADAISSLLARSRP